MRAVYWILGDDGKTPVPLEDDGMGALGWAVNRKKHSWRVAKSYIGSGYISTVFLGIDHGFHTNTPVLFETMVFDIDGMDEECERYCTWDEAEAGHHAMVARVKEHLKHGNRTTD